VNPPHAPAKADKGEEVRSSPAGTAALYPRQMKMDSSEFAADEKT
jgi:hypothetical protein